MFKHGWFTSDGCFRVYVHPNRLIARLGISVARAAIVSAVTRNRIKRQIRASFRTRRVMLPAVDIVVQVKARASGVSKPEIRASLEWHWQELTKRCATS